MGTLHFISGDILLYYWLHYIILLVTLHYYIALHGVAGIHQVYLRKRQELWVCVYIYSTGANLQENDMATDLWIYGSFPCGLSVDRRNKDINEPWLCKMYILMIVFIHYLFIDLYIIVLLANR